MNPHEMTDDELCRAVAEALDYEPLTGEFTWKARPRTHFLSDMVCKRWNTRYSGRVAGGVGSTGYVYISLGDKRYPAHKLAWIAYHGVLPVSQIDHINGIRDDNRIVNLRDVTEGENKQNMPIRAHNTSGKTGVDFHRHENKWRARITTSGKTYCLGYFKEKDDAIRAREDAELSSAIGHPFRRLTDAATLPRAVFEASLLAKRAQG